MSPDKEKTCYLCGLPLRKGTVLAKTETGEYGFCCPGCRQVFFMILDANDEISPDRFKETEIFKTCLEMGVIPSSEEDLIQREAAGDPDAAEPRPVPAPAGREDDAPDHALPLSLKVHGMWCPACAWVIQESLKKSKGVTCVRCVFAADRLWLDYDPAVTSPDRIGQTIQDLGYQPEVSGAAKKRRQKEFVRFFVSAFLTMNIMMLSFGVYAGFFTNLAPDAVRYLSWTAFAMSLGVMIFGGAPIFRRAAGQVKTLAFGMETLVSMGALSAFFFSIWSMATGSLHVYFDTASMLVTLVLLGKLLELRAKDKVREDLEAFFSLKPAKVRIYTPQNPRGRYASADMLEKNDLFLVQDQEVVAADGIVLEGRARVDESSLTGEPRLKLKKPGDWIRAGSTVREGGVRVRAERVGGDSAFGAMMAMLETTLGTPVPGEDRWLKFLVPLVVGLAVLTGMAVGLSGAPVHAAMIRGVTVLVISCPCALGVAIPLAKVAGVALAGKKGILVRRMDAFEKARDIDTVVFDKTGTITQGQWRLHEILPNAPFTAESALAAAAGLEREAEHPAAPAILEAAKSRGVSPVSAENVQSHPKGVSGEINGQKARIGAASFVRGSPRDDLWPRPVADSSAAFVFLSIDHRPAAVFVFKDAIRPDAAQTLNTLRAWGKSVALVSGDTKKTVRAVAWELGITDFSGDCLPLDKADYLTRLSRAGKKPAMVGDGVNDAPALAAARLGIGLHSGRSFGGSTGDVTLMGGSLTKVCGFFRLAKKVRTKIRQNLFFSITYNLVGIPVAMSGLLSPVLAVLAMLLSSLSVIGNTLLLVRGDRQSRLGKKETAL